MDPDGNNTENPPSGDGDFGNNSGKTPSNKQRGPYKAWLHDPSIPIPKSTIFSRKKARVEAAQHVDEVQLEIATEEVDVVSSSLLLEDECAAPNPPPVEFTQDPNFETDHSGSPPPMEPPHDPHEAVCESRSSSPVESVSHALLVQSKKSPSPTSEHQHIEEKGSSKQKINYVEKYSLNDPLHRNFPLSRLDVLLMILHMAVRHCHTEPFVIDQIKFVNALFGSNVLDISYYIFKNLFKATATITKHYVCVDCQLYLGKNLFEEMDFKNCPSCTKRIDVHSIESGNYFIMLSVREQIEELLRKPGLKIVSHLNRVPGAVRDVLDGIWYQKLSQPGYPLNDENALTVCFNTDGVAVHGSSNNSLWPIQLNINEIAPEQRFRVENLILAGLWFGKSAPNMALFLEPFLEEIVDLSVNPIEYNKPDGSSVKCPVYPLLCSFDSVAKPKVVCQKQFNAYMGCLYCYHPNDSIIGENRMQRFYDTSVNYQLRTEDEVVRDMFQADELHRKGELRTSSVNGFLGISILTKFCKLLDHSPCSTFHLVWSVSIDYMHAALEGVSADLLNMYESILTTEQITTLDEYLKNISPPQGMTRRPRSFSLRSHWKAKEFRAFMLYYALPCLLNLLPRKYFSNLTHFVNVLHILLSDTITPRALSDATSSLDSFVTGYQRLYGLQNVTYNLHVLKHLIDMVVQMGPLYCYSNFVFESGNGYLVSLIRGTKSVINEIATKHTTIQTVSKIVMHNTVSIEALKFCGDVMGRSYSQSKTEVDGVLTTGSKSYGDVSQEECELLRERHVNVCDLKVPYYNRVIKDCVIFTSKSYTKAKVYDDSCVLLEDGTYAVIDKIIQNSHNELLCLVKPIRIVRGSDIIPAMKRCSFDVFDTPCVISIFKIQRKCLYIWIGEQSFVCHIPNFYERD